MRPTRFESLLRDLLNGAPGVQKAESFAAAGYDRRPYGLVVTFPNGSRVLLQIAATSRPGDRYDEEEEIFEGDAPSPVPMPEAFASGKVKLDQFDKFVLALVLNSGSREIAEGYAYSARETPGAIRYGATLTCHSGAKIYINAVEALPAGRNWGERAEFDLPEAV